MIEVLHPAPNQGVIPISHVLDQIDNITNEIAFLAHDSVIQRFVEINVIMGQIAGMILEIPKIIGESQETISFGPQGETISETGHNEAMSITVGIGPVTAHATAFSSNPNIAVARVGTIAASAEGIGDAVAAASGDVVMAVTT